MSKIRNMVLPLKHDLPSTPPTVRILHIRNAAQRPLGEATDEETP